MLKDSELVGNEWTKISLLSSEPVNKYFIIPGNTNIDRFEYVKLRSLLILFRSNPSGKGPQGLHAKLR